MASSECFHFTYLSRANLIRDNGLQARLEENSKAVGDKKPKISYSDGKIGAIGLFANFYEVYNEHKNGKRKLDTPEEVELNKKIKASKSFEDYLGDGMYLIFDGTSIENTGGNTGKGGIYDASTTKTIGPEKLSVGMIRNNDTGEVSYSKYDYINYLMATMTKEEEEALIPDMQRRLREYREAHQAEMEKFGKGNFSKGLLSIDKFCEIFKDDIDKSVARYEASQAKEESPKQAGDRKPWELSPAQLEEFNKGAETVIEGHEKAGIKQPKQLEDTQK